MAHWLMKSEPDVFGWDDLVAKDKRGEVEQWHGVRNFTARNNMMTMALGDEAFFYHSNIGKEIVGIMKVVALAHPDSTAEPDAKGKPALVVRRRRAGQALQAPGHARSRSRPSRRSPSMALIKYSRLSVQPVTDAEWALICRMGGL